MVKVFKDLRPFSQDARGFLLRILDDGKIEIKSVLLMHSIKGAIRGNHWHKKDTHYCYMISGRMRYNECVVKNGRRGPIKTTIIKSGEMVLSKPRSYHSMIFLEDSLVVVLSTRSRHQANYEKDTVRS